MWYVNSFTADGYDGQVCGVFASVDDAMTVCDTFVRIFPDRMIVVDVAPPAPCGRFGV